MYFVVRFLGEFGLKSNLFYQATIEVIQKNRMEYQR